MLAYEGQRLIPSICKKKAIKKGRSCNARTALKLLGPVFRSEL